MWMSAFRSWPRLIFQTLAERRAIGIPRSLRCAEARPDFAPPIILAAC